jgi:cytochrome c-type biogenesis protein CcmH/NrfG
VTRKNVPKRPGRPAPHESSRGVEPAGPTSDTSEKRKRGYEVGSSGYRRPGERRLFSERLRDQGKWIFVALIFFFAISFALGSVGASGGLSFLDYFSNRPKDSATTTTQATDTPSVKQATANAQKSPKDPQAWVALGDALSATTTGDQTSLVQRAIAAYAKANTLKPKDKTIIGKLAVAYTRRATDQLTKASNLQVQADQIQSNANPLATVFGTNPLIEAANANVDSAANSVGTSATPFTNAGTAAAKSAATQYAALTALDPKDAESWYEAGVWWQNAGEYQKALDAYRRFTTLVPADPAVATIEAQISALSAYITPPATEVSVASTPKSTATKGSSTARGSSTAKGSTTAKGTGSTSK